MLLATLGTYRFCPQHWSAHPPSVFHNRQLWVRSVDPDPTVLGMASTDEETGLVKSGEKKEAEDLDPDKDPELVKNGGRFTSKKAILQVTWRFPVDFKDPLNIIALLY
eukprot:symbB.v1.2.024432.t1/scaffold2314.1/size82632/5